MHYSAILNSHALITIASLMLFCFNATAATLSCYVDPQTDARQCIDPKEIREKDGIRFTPFYTGGPNGVRKTSYTLHVNCGTGVTHLKDYQGVSFAGGDGDETRAIRSLRTWICDAVIPSKKVKK